MRHDPGLAASPPVRYILKVARSGSPCPLFWLPAVDGQPPHGPANRCVGTRMAGRGEGDRPCEGPRAQNSWYEPMTVMFSTVGGSAYHSLRFSSISAYSGNGS